MKPEIGKYYKVACYKLKLIHISKSNDFPYCFIDEESEKIMWYKNLAIESEWVEKKKGNTWLHVYYFKSNKEILNCMSPEPWDIFNSSGVRTHIKSVSLCEFDYE